MDVPTTNLDSRVSPQGGVLSPHFSLHLFHLCLSTILVVSLSLSLHPRSCLTLISVSRVSCSPAVYLILSESLLLLSLYICLLLFFLSFIPLISLCFLLPSLFVFLCVFCFLPLSPLFSYSLILTSLPLNFPLTPSDPPASDTLAGLGLPTPLMAGAPPPTVQLSLSRQR